MTEPIGTLSFVGEGQPHKAPWFRSDDGAVENSIDAWGHPARYEADEGLVAAVNTALLLNKPLLLTGNPGTGKSQLAERIAWELQLGPVLRFEAQSLSEANDLFYRFDLVGRMAESRIQHDRGQVTLSDNLGGLRPRPEDDITHPVHFIEFGPLGKAIFLTGAAIDGADAYKKSAFDHLRRRLIRNGEFEPGRSVVLIDEIDKASRDFPNDLLNGIDRMEFKIRELDNLLIAAPNQVDRRPIVIITSNLERDLPPPFLRRCAFYHIPDPNRARLARIVHLQKFFNRKDLDDNGLPPFYGQLLDFFLDFRQQNSGRHAYEPGTQELLDVTEVLQRHNIDDNATLPGRAETVRSAFAAIAKNRSDAEALIRYFETWKPAVA